jgi:DNA-binding IscR family transcriptional regulator
VEKPSTCKRSSFCIAHDLWGEASKALAATLGKTTLAALVERQKEKRQRQAANYEI